jgi:hypothetical protein
MEPRWLANLLSFAGLRTTGIASRLSGALETLD